MKLYYFSSASHKVLTDEWFLPSISDDVELIATQAAQVCRDGTYRTPGFNDLMAQKVDLIISAIDDNPNDVFIYSDVDVQFFRPIRDDIEQLMQQKDLLILKDSPRGVMCPGFFASRGTDSLRVLWTAIRRGLAEQPDKHDQDILNDYVLGRPPVMNLFLSRIIYLISGLYLPVRYQTPPQDFGIAWDYLPDRYYCYGRLAWRCWRPGAKLKLPDGIAVHHANWTLGVERKIQQLQAVKEQVQQRRTDR